MEYVAIREKYELRRVESRLYITPNLSARRLPGKGRAVLPANINHPEAEPMIILHNFLVKNQYEYRNSATTSSINEEVEKALWSCKWGGDTLMDLYRRKHS